MTRRPPALYTEMRFSGTKDEINDQWREARKSGIGGSDVASIMGLNKYSSPLEVWLIKTGKQEAPDLSDKQAVEWGNILEDVVVDKFKADHFGEYKVFRKNAMLVSKERPWAFANLDRYIIDRDGRRGVLEIKTAGLYRADDWADGVPLYYLTQVTHYLDVTGFDFAMVAVLIGGQDYREFYIERNEDDIQAVRTYVDTFWHDFVETDTPPALIGNDSEADTLLGLYPSPSDEFGQAIDADIDLDKFLANKDEIKRLEAENKLIENNIKNLIGGAKGLMTDAHKITWTRSQATKFDKDKLLADHPEFNDQYKSTYTRNGGLRITARKDI